MRKGRFGRLVAGTVLALIVAAPTLSISAPDRRRIGAAAAGHAQRSPQLPLPELSSPRGAAAATRRPHAPRHTPRCALAAAGRALPRHPPQRASRAAAAARGRAPRSRTAAADPARPRYPARTVCAAAGGRGEAPANKPDTGALALGTALDKPLAANDFAISDRLRAILTAKTFGRAMERAPERKAIQDFYAAHNYAPLWIKDGGLTPRAKAVIAKLQNAAAEGLNAFRLSGAALRHLQQRRATGQGRYRTDLLTADLRTPPFDGAHRAAPRVRAGRIRHPHARSGNDPKTVFEARDVDAAIESYNPPDEGFRALKQKLADCAAKRRHRHQPYPERPGDPPRPQGPAHPGRTRATSV